MSKVFSEGQLHSEWWLTKSKVYNAHTHFEWWFTVSKVYNAHNHFE